MNKTPRFEIGQKVTLVTDTKAKTVTDVMHVKGGPFEFYEYITDDGCRHPEHQLLELITYHLESGYSHKEYQGTREYRALTFEEFANLEKGREVLVVTHRNQVVRAKVNGKPQLWKRELQKCEIPFKRGLKECSCIRYEDGRHCWGLMPVTEV